MFKNTCKHICWKETYSVFTFAFLQCYNQYLFLDYRDTLQQSMSLTSELPRAMWSQESASVTKTWTPRCVLPSPSTVPPPRARPCSPTRLCLSPDRLPWFPHSPRRQREFKRLRRRQYWPHVIAFPWWSSRLASPTSRVSCERCNVGKPRAGLNFTNLYLWCHYI